MTLKTLIFLISIFVKSFCFCQHDTRDIHFYEIMKVRNVTSNEIIGKEYFFENWLEASIILKDSSQYTLKKVNLNLWTNSFDVLIKNVVKEIPANLIKEVLFKDDKTTLRFSAALNYKKYDIKNKGFIEKTECGEYQILVHHYSTLLKPDPQSAVLGLEKRPKLIQSSINYILYKNKLYTVKSKNDLKPILKSKFKNAIQLINEKSIDVRNSYDLAWLLNSL